MKFVKSPMNYTGGKYKLLNQIIPLFSSEIDIFYDLFAGGLDVSINIESKKIIANDSLSQLISLYSFLKENDIKYILTEIENNIIELNLSKENKEAYITLRNKYNKTKKPLYLFLLICYSFNHNLRFNKKGEFNIPFGMNRSHYNNKIRENLIYFCKKLKNIEFSNKSFDLVEIKNIENKKTFVYADPPYLLTTAIYNQNNGWSIEMENKLLEYLRKLNNNNIKFALSNVIENRNGEHTILKEWVKENKFNIHYLNMDYSNSSYQKRDKKTKDKEVLITNY